MENEQDINEAVAVMPTSRTAVQFIRFAVVGVINTVVDFGVYIALTRLSDFWGSHIILAAVVSFLAAVTSSFLLNNYWTFQSDGSAMSTKSVKFLIVAVGGLAWNVIIISVLTSSDWYDIHAKVVATLLVMLWNFFLQKFWTFKAK